MFQTAKVELSSTTWTPVNLNPIYVSSSRYEFANFLHVISLLLTFVFDANTCHKTNKPHRFAKLPQKSSDGRTKKQI